MTGDRPTDGGRDDTADARTAATDELMTLVLDELGPTMQAFRGEVARRLGLEPAELTCLDLLRRLGPLRSPTLADRLGLSRSATAKLLRRLEAAGHLERSPTRGRQQELTVTLVPHEHRDHLLDDVRRFVRYGLAGVVADARLEHPDRLAFVAGWLVKVEAMLLQQTRRLADQAAHERLLERRRGERDPG